jgi:cob(I)alamin adenosyltransferase
MKIYTKTGDSGETSLVGGQRVPKDDLRIEAYGTVDELNASVGLAISLLPVSMAQIGSVLTKIQHHLLDIGSELASLSDRKVVGMEIPTVTLAKVEWLELGIDVCDEELEPLKQFILPGGAPAASALHVARTICRRAERRVISLQKKTAVNPQLIKYLNRLSDLLFTMARLVNARAGRGDIPWQKPSDEKA